MRCRSGANSVSYYCLMVGCMVVWWGGCLAEELASAAASSLAEQCSTKLPEVMTCVAFASGKESRPQHKCCESVEGMTQSNPACLCFLIQQVHNGTNPTLQKMNIQEPRLLLLPSACNIANASITHCPKLLKLPPNSPDAAIFNNVTNTPAGGGSATSSASTTTPSHGFKHEPITPIMLSLLFFLVFFLISTTFAA